MSEINPADSDPLENVSRAMKQMERIQQLEDYIRNDQVEEAMACFDDALNNNSTYILERLKEHPDLAKDFIQRCKEKGNYQGAIAILSTYARNIYGTQKEYALQLAQLYSKNSDQIEAATLYAAVLDLEPDNPEAKLALALHNPNTDAMLKQYDETLDTVAVHKDQLGKVRSNMQFADLSMQLMTKKAREEADASGDMQAKIKALEKTQDINPYAKMELAAIYAGMPEVQPAITTPELRAQKRFWHGVSIWLERPRKTPFPKLSPVAEKEYDEMQERYRNADIEDIRKDIGELRERIWEYDRSNADKILDVLEEKLGPRSIGERKPTIKNTLDLADMVLETLSHINTIDRTNYTFLRRLKMVVELDGKGTDEIIMSNEMEKNPELRAAVPNGRLSAFFKPFWTAEAKQLKEYGLVLETWDRCLETVNRKLQSFENAKKNFKGHEIVAKDYFSLEDIADKYKIDMNDIEVRESLFKASPEDKEITINNGLINGIRIKHQNISDISDFSRFAGLETLVLSYNKIAEIKELYLPNLNYLDLSNNGISKIENLNACINLRYLHLCDNQIEKIEGLDNNFNLEVLNLAKNKIEKIDELYHRNKLKVLKLGSNRITKIENLNGSVALEELDLSCNRIADIPTFMSMANLQKLDLYFNQIKAIGGLKYLSNLRQLCLFNNQIKSIQGLGQLSRLETLHLENNEIEEIQMLDKLHSLKRLHLSKNKIKTMKNLDSLTELEALRLDENEISKIQGLGNQRKLRVLNLGNNPIKKMEGLEVCENLERLMLHATQIPKIEGLEKCRKLEVLDLEMNVGVKAIEGLENQHKLTDLLLTDCPVHDWKPLLELKKTTMPNLAWLSASDGYTHNNEDIDALQQLGVLVAPDRA
jgi:Leucine-rich repeat (LRR) protein